MKVSRFLASMKKKLSWKIVGLNTEVCQDYKHFMATLVHQDSTEG